MSSCAINITGTTGSVTINYKLDGVSNSMTGTAGQTLYINSEATNVTYTNLNHLTTDASAESDCIVLQSLHSGYYIFSWETTSILNLQIDRLLVGDTEYIFSSPINFNSKDLHKICDEIEKLNLGHSIISTSYNFSKTKKSTILNKFVLKVDGSKDVYFRVKNVSSSGITTFLYIKGVDTLDPVPEKYTACSSYIKYLENIIIYTTTTTSTTTLVPTTTSTTTEEPSTTSTTTEEPSTTSTTTEEIVESTTTSTTEI